MLGSSLAAQPEHETISVNRIGSPFLKLFLTNLSSQASSKQSQDAIGRVCIQSFDCLTMVAQNLFKCLYRTVTSPNPDYLRRKAEQHAQITEVDIFRDYCKATLLGKVAVSRSLARSSPSK